MKSITKRKISDTEITLLVKNAFGNSVNIKEIKNMDDGWFNAVYLVALDDTEIV